MDAKRKSNAKMILMTCLRASVTCIVVLGAATVARGQTTGNPVPSDVEKAVEARLAEIQSAAQALDPNRVFDFVLENDKGALAQNGKLFLTRQTALKSTQQGYFASVGLTPDLLRRPENLVAFRTGEDRERKESTNGTSARQPPNESIR
jgi:hypothetical protein